MTVGDDEVFGPVLCIKRVKNFEEGMALINANRFRQRFSHLHPERLLQPRVRQEDSRRDGGHQCRYSGACRHVPVRRPQQSFFGDLHTLGKDGLRFFTESKCVTTTWFSEEEKKKAKVDTWDGVLGR